MEVPDEIVQKRRYIREVFSCFFGRVCELCVMQKTNSKKTFDKQLIFIVIRAGFEPTTHSLEGCCSIQLSYRTILLLYRLAKITQIQQ